jgi:hypothetical protein
MIKKWFSKLQSHMLVAFIPWIFFGIFYGNTEKSVLIGSIGALALTVLCNFKELSKGFILPWGSLFLFVFLAVNELFAFVVLQPIEGLRVINTALAAIVIFSMIIGKPFTLQYAREQADRSKWNKPLFIKINWILTTIWAVLLIIMSLPSYFLSYEQIHASWFWNYGLLILCIVIGMRCNKHIPKLMRK